MGETGGDDKRERVMVRWTHSGVSLDCVTSAGEQEVFGKSSLAEAVAGVSGRAPGVCRWKLRILQRVLFMKFDLECDVIKEEFEAVLLYWFFFISVASPDKSMYIENRVASSRRIRR